MGMGVGVGVLCMDACIHVDLGDSMYMWCRLCWWVDGGSSGGGSSTRRGHPGCVVLQELLTAATLSTLHYSHLEQR